MAQLTEITAVPIDEKFRRDSFTIMSAKQQQPVDADLPRAFSLLGEADPGELQAQLPFRFWGRWEQKQWGGETQHNFRFDSFCSIQPHNQTGIVKYLQQAKYVGPATAHALWDEFQGDAVKVLREEPERAAETVGNKRFSAQKAREASKVLERLKAAEDLTIQLYDLFDGRGFGKVCVRQALQLWGAKAHEILTRYPHRAQALRGVGFLKADRFYLELGYDPSRLKRQAYCLSYATRKESDSQGHVWMQWEKGVEYLRAAVAGTKVTPTKALTLAVRGKIMRTRTDEQDRLWVADIQRADAEEYCCRRLIEMMANESVEWPSLDRPEFAELTDHQRTELRKALAGPVVLLGGRPGTGKSFTLVRLVRAIQMMHGQGCVKVMAPTGKAAQRVKELMAEAKLSGLTPTTIHSGLGVEAVDEGGWEFKHNESNPLDAQFVVVEEASMLGTGLFRSLLAAIPKGCGLLLVGDCNQLPPVEYGAPLRDMIEAGLPCGELKEIHRNSGTIVRVCTAIVDQQPWEPDDTIDLQAEDPKNLMLHTCSGSVAPARVCGLLEQIRDDSPYDPVWDAQVLVAVNKRSPLSRTVLNRRLQDLLNPVDGDGDTRTPFRLGDKVIQLRNSFLPFATQSKDGTWKSADEKAMVANGEIGRVLHAEQKKTVVKFPSSQKPVIIFRADRKQDEDKNGEGDENGGNKADTGCDLDLAYAVTTHKSQGSQWKIIIYCLDEYPGASGEYGVCDRAHFYTGVSRAQTACFLVGMKHTADSICRRTFIQRRKTFMVETIRRYATDAGLVLADTNTKEIW